VSHSKERKEKDCLNCGTLVGGRYCQVCGQENTEPKETVWTLVSHFFNDITHFDGKFFSSVKYLLTKPGFLPAEYIKGRRAGYLHPIRMYVFTSAFFFIIFFSVFNPEKMIGKEKSRDVQLAELKGARVALQTTLDTATDAVLRTAIQRAFAVVNKQSADMQEAVQKEQLLDSLKAADRKRILDSVQLQLQQHPELKSSVVDMGIIKVSDGEEDPKKKKGGLTINNKAIDYDNVIAYEAIQKELPEGHRDNWFMHAMNKKAILYNVRSKTDQKGANTMLIERFMHNLPQALFISLPVFALILLFLYNRKKFYYADHGIFSIHLYCATFLILLLIFSFTKLKAITGWGWLSVFEGMLAISIFFYLYKAMRRFYGQGRGKTILKFFILNICAFLVISILITGIFLLSFIQLG
jgi:Protein of unknown function (DUF3667)